MITPIFDALKLNTVVNGNLSRRRKSDLSQNRKDVISLLGNCYLSDAKIESSSTTKRNLRKNCMSCLDNSGL